MEKIAQIGNYCQLKTACCQTFIFLPRFNKLKQISFWGLRSLFVHCSMVVRSSFALPSLFLRSGFASEAKERPQHRDCIMGD